jgi:hypothetical protein
MKTRYSECAKPRAAQGFGPRRPVYRLRWQSRYSHTSIGRSKLSNRTGFGHRRFNTGSRGRRKRLQSSREARASDPYRIARVIRIANTSGAIAVTHSCHGWSRGRGSNGPAPMSSVVLPHQIPRCKEFHYIPKQLRSLSPGILSPSTRSILQNHMFSTS